MLNQLRTFFDHSRHKLKVRDVDALLDVLAFQGTEALSQPFNYRVELTCTDGDIGAEKMLGKRASFSLYGSLQPLPIPGLSVPTIKPLRVLNGVITGFKRLSGSVDEARYEITLEPHLALLGQGRQFRIYQHQSVPQIVESILRSRHDFEGQDFFFNLVREYPRREQVMQYGESDLAFISRLLADVGIWYRFTRDERLNIDVVEFHDDQRHYQFDVKMAYRAARDSSFEVSFEAIPYSETVCFRPALQNKPQIAGTVPARVTSPQEHDPYGHIDIEGRYKVNFLFDRDSWKPGEESLWLRLARPYAGDTHGLHLPLIPGTEVAIAFEQGDPDRPYIAHALHDSQHPDHVTLGKRDYTRNVLRTPANNKLRMEDRRGQEHIKLSTEHSGKSQLNLGHLVDAQKQKRGEGFELRTDGWGAIRGGKGVFISADVQPKAQGQMLDMSDALGRLQQAGDQLDGLSTDAQAANADPADAQAQLNLLKQDLEQLKSSVLLLSAPQGIALTSGKHLQLAAQDNLMINAGAEADISVVKRLFIGVGQGLSLFVRKLGIKLIANQGPVSVQAQNDTLELMARHGLEIISTEDEIRIVAKKKITLNAGGSYITLDQNCIESGTQGDYNIKSAHFDYLGPASMGASHPEYPLSQSKQPLRLSVPQAPNASNQGWAGMPYTLYADGAVLKQGVLDKTGHVLIDHQVVTQQYRMELANGVNYQIPVPTDYRNAEQAHLANGGLHNHLSQTAAEVSQPTSHTDHRALYAAAMEKVSDKEGKTP